MAKDLKSALQEQRQAGIAAVNDRWRYPNGSKPRGMVRFKPWCDADNPIGSPPLILVEGVDVRSPEFLKTRAWRELRYRALREGGRKCECCGARSWQARLNVDHIKPRKLRPDLALDPWNLQILCDDCNAGKGNSDQSDWR